MEDIETLLTRIERRQSETYYGKYRAIVADVADPENLGRIKAEVPSILGEETTHWAMPCVPYAGPGHGMAFIPEVGDGVWIEFEAGSLYSPIWTGCWWANGQRPDPSAETVRLIATSGGHQVLIDEDANEIKLIHPDGAEIALTSEGITLSMGQTKIALTSSEVVINEGMAKITTAGASLVNDAFKVGA